MSKIVDFYNVRPGELKPGDVLACVVTLHVGYRQDENGNPTHYRVYRCRWPDTQVSKGIPQGANLGHLQQQVAKALFPVPIDGLKPD